MCRPPPTALQCTQRQQPRREHNNLPTSLLFFFPSAWLSRPICAIRERCQSAQVLCMLCVSLCECVMLIWTHIFTLLISLPPPFSHLPSRPWMWTCASCLPSLSSNSLLPITPSVSSSTWTAFFFFLLAVHKKSRQWLQCVRAGQTCIVECNGRERGKVEGKEWSNWNAQTRHDCILAPSLSFRGFYAVFCLNMTVAVLAEFVSWECVSTLAVSLSTEYLNEMLTVPGATCLRSPLHIIWGTHALLPITPFP